MGSRDRDLQDVRLLTPPAGETGEVVSILAMIEPEPQPGKKNRFVAVNV